MWKPCPAIRRRTLCYYLYPRAPAERTESNLALIEPYLDQFDRRHLVIAHDETTLPRETVADMVGKHWSTIKGIPNTPSLRELPGWEELLRTAMDPDPEHAILYAHARGTSRPLSTAAGRGSWAMTRIMARVLLGTQEGYGDLLRWHHMVGAFRRSDGHWIPGRPRIRVPWDYPGTWYWFRAREMDMRPWGELPRTQYTTEAAPGLLFDRQEGAALLGELPDQCYDERTWTDNPIYRSFLE